MSPLALRFLSTPSARRATREIGPPEVFKIISIHALREEGDELRFDVSVSDRAFLSTPSARRATVQLRELCGDLLLISIHALREEGDLTALGYDRSRIISIHALREEGDGFLLPGLRKSRNFYPRPPRGGRQPNLSIPARRSKFLSTPSARRATGICTVLSLILVYFYPRPPRGGRPSGSPRSAAHRAISIHALREEGDSLPTAAASLPMYFYPRPPRGGRQQKQRQNLYFQTNYTTFCTNLEEL